MTLAFLGVCVIRAGGGRERRLPDLREAAEGETRVLGPTDNRAPSLEKLDRINYRLLGWGFLMLSLAIVTGAIWADATWGHFWSWEPQETWTLVDLDSVRCVAGIALDGGLARAASRGAYYSRLYRC